VSSLISSVLPPKLILFAGVQSRADQPTNLKKGTLGTTKAPSYKPDKVLKGAIQQIRQIQVMRDLQTNIRQLVSEIDVFSIPDRANLTETRVAVSSAPDKILAIAFDRAPLLLHQEEITCLAQAQINTSEKLITTGTPSLDAGDYTFDLTVGDDTSSVTVRVVKTGTGADSNSDLLSKIGREIMTQDERLEAFMILTTEPDADGVDQDMVALAVRAKETGRDITFELSDTSGTLIETTGLDRMFQAGGKAAVFHDQRLYNSNYNEIAINEDQLALKLIKPTDGIEKINVEKGLEAVYRQAQRLIDEYNGFIEFLEANTMYIKPNIRAELRSLEEDHFQALHGIGLTPFAQDTIAISDGFFETLVAEPEAIQPVLTEPDGFFAGVRDKLVGILGRSLAYYVQVITKDSYASPLTALNTYENRALSSLSLVV